MDKPKGYDESSRGYKKYKVYGIDATFGISIPVGDTFAKSPEQAVNNVRYRRYGLNLTNDPFYAVEVKKEELQNE